MAQISHDDIQSKNLCRTHTTMINEFFNVKTVLHQFALQVFFIAGIIKGDVTERHSKANLLSSSVRTKEVAKGAAAIIGTASLIGCSLVNENYEARLKAENEKKYDLIDS